MVLSAEPAAHGIIQYRRYSRDLLRRNSRASEPKESRRNCASGFPLKPSESYPSALESDGPMVPLLTNSLIQSASNLIAVGIAIIIADVKLARVSTSVP